MEEEEENRESWKRPKNIKNALSPFSLKIKSKDRMKGKWVLLETTGMRIRLGPPKLEQGLFHWIGTTGD